MTDQRPLPTQATVDDPDLVFLHALGVVLGEGVVRASDRDLVASFEALGLRPEGGFDPAWGAETARRSWPACETARHSSTRRSVALAPPPTVGR